MSDTLEKLKEESAEAETQVEALKGEVSKIESADEVDKEALKAKKAELRTAESNLKKTNTAVGKEEAKIEREAERERKKAEKEAAKKEREAERERKKEEREAEKKRKAEEREANRMPEQNGIRRPKPETKCGRTWALADKLSAELGQPVPIAQLLEAANKEGDLNEGNTKAEYARWRKFNNVTGRVTLPDNEKEEKAES